METLMAAPPPAITRLAAATITRNPSPAKSRPKLNLAGLDSSSPRRPSETQSQANTGARVTTNTELADWSHNVGTSHPNTTRSVESRANRLSEVGACPKAAQKMVAKVK